jgi:tetratricopeptide (TPR) repeat protein
MSSLPASDAAATALLCGAGWLCMARGSYGEADALLREALAALRSREGADDAGAARHDVQLCLCNLAKNAQARGDLTDAEALWTEALAAARGLFGDAPNAAALDATRALALVATAAGRETQAARLFKAAAELAGALREEAARPLPQRVAAQRAAAAAAAAAARRAPPRPFTLWK